ncbi:MAG: nucleotidyltransferase domain-containing protein [Nanoarchaeota archaeon]|nr:nucleotidyltransferase domain-containing protein [Nanoarchaeota archaeon]MBU1632036.1 nucleotidyltransferase domain-containing protein [Nanoarchaeota archaeon]MBU1875956.1 nucleotidyltransferase domain-containing protein [Nanoarchaeota archaeon]
MDNKRIKKILLDLDKSKAIKFIILFGSKARGTANKLSDTDIAVYYQGNNEERFKFRIKALGELPDNIDLQIFQDLPLLLKKEILSGKVIYYDNFQFIFDQFMKIIREFDSFEKYYLEYIASLGAET